MPVLKNVKHEKFAQLCASGLSRSEAYRKAAGARAGKNSDANSDDWLNARGVRERIRELQERNSRKSEMTREELLTFYADVIRTPADQVPAGSPVIQAYEMTESGPKIRICDKSAATTGRRIDRDFTLRILANFSGSDNIGVRHFGRRRKPASLRSGHSCAMVGRYRPCYCY